MEAIKLKYLEDPNVVLSLK